MRGYLMRNVKLEAAIICGDAAIIIYIYLLIYLLLYVCVYVYVCVCEYIYIYIEIIDYSESDSMRDIWGKLDKSNT